MNKTKNLSVGTWFRRNTKFLRKKWNDARGKADS